MGFYAVADGVGGAPGGHIASRIAVDSAEAFLRAAFSGRPHMPGCFREDTSALTRLISLAVTGANTAVYHESLRVSALSGMGTTFAGALFRDDHLAIAHVGDSRIYRLRDGILTQLTEDHSLAQEHFRRGLLSRSELLACDYRNIISRVVGMEPNVEAAVAEHPVFDGDRYLFCTDGLTNMLTHDEIQGILAADAFPKTVCSSFVAAALRAGGQDNVTVVVVVCKR